MNARLKKPRYCDAGHQLRSERRKSDCYECRAIKLKQERERERREDEGLAAQMRANAPRELSVSFAWPTPRRVVYRIERRR